MRTKKPLQIVGCGDWHLGWGLGGHNKVGKLSIEIVQYCPINFIWRGSSQGRHGQKFNPAATARFSVFGDKIKITNIKGSFPVYSEIIKSANILLRENNLPELPDGVTFE